MRFSGGTRRAKEREAASTSEINRFETEMLSSRGNLTALMELSGTWNDLVQDCVPLNKLILGNGYFRRYERSTGADRRCSCHPTNSPKRNVDVLVSNRCNHLTWSGIQGLGTRS